MPGLGGGDLIPKGLEQRLRASSPSDLARGYFRALWLTWLGTPSSIHGPLPGVPCPSQSLFRNLMPLSSLGLDYADGISGRGRERFPSDATWLRSAPSCCLSKRHGQAGSIHVDNSRSTLLS